ncbi:hypothetical protein WJ0W_006583 [Paenibacillus melissococcoides]|uniref:AraC-type arabinose-binding/dimerisation domain-containing protein n=1 Tax=Paenibacillus melissococcoides TaxID=2912268 RepID=A0ABN8UDU7_9BACL|nr:MULTISPECIES: hypothetical protein [Paenibacillus]MEB9892325.1 hypothetical protein [Bacillus cereus]CAH8249398.1 hypothetical protein WJ0W_006583 [Paenibacillus melissococcoides]CAH8721190.1 hypothetical protein WDD9_006172 [Paenibacillus melissococcoides]CAH8721522.1 hypothetical protein HTL2_006402 [Paenibacillus melissococcoides]GIO81797.1 hypothetical protein J6TS7_54070 [Paenibacillus dendritiformis]
MGHATPERLRNEQYMSLSSPFRIFRHHIDTRIEVHWHEFFEMALVVGGQGIHAVNGTSVSPIGQRTAPADNVCRGLFCAGWYSQRPGET